MSTLSTIANWGKRHFVLVIFGVFAVKLALLFWTAHPFDFSAFVGLLQRHSLYDWNPFEYWNKGNFLVVLWYPFYAAYLLVLQFFHIAPDQLALLHFFLKFPFWVIDLLCIPLITTLGFYFTRSESKARWAAFLWAINPLVFGVYGVHGHYEVLVAFSILLLFFALVLDMPIVFGFAFALAFSTKYFVVILAPLFFVYLLYKKKYKFMLRASVTALAFICIFYIQFVNHPEFIPQTIDSIQTLSQAYATPQITSVKVPQLNFFSAIRYFLGMDTITSTDSPGWFAVTDKAYYFAGLFCLIIYLRQLYQIYRQKIKYTALKLFEDSLLLLAGFTILLTNFQWHYVVWFIPFVIILALVEDFFAGALIGLTGIGFLYFFRNEYGPRTFFLDFFDQAQIRTVSSTADGMTKMLSFGVVALFVILIIYIFTKKARPFSTATKSIYTLVAVTGVVWILLIGTIGQGIWQYAHEDSHNTVLAYRRPDAPRGLVAAHYPALPSDSTEVVFAHKSNNKALILEELAPFIERGETSQFQAFILFNPIVSLPRTGEFMFNNCPIQFSSRTLFRSPNDKKHYLAIAVPLRCVIYDNRVVFDPSIYLFGPMPEMQLYVGNVPSNALYYTKLTTFITVLGGIGFLLFVVGFVVLGYVLRIIKKILHEEAA